MRLTSSPSDITDVRDHIDKVVSFVLANLIWVILSIPVVTLPAATAGLFTVMSLWVRGRQPELFQAFFGGMRRHWLTSSVVGLMNLLVIGLVALNLSIFPMMEMTNPIAFLSRSLTVGAIILLALINLYVWPLMVILELPPRALIQSALSLVFAHPLASAGVTVTGLTPFMIGLVLPGAIWLTVLFSAGAYIVSRGTWRIIKLHLTEDKRAQLETSR